MLVGVLAVTITAVSTPTRAHDVPVAAPSKERVTPAIVSSAPSRLDVFWTTADGRLAHRYRPAGGWWTRILDLGGSLASQPAVVSRRPGHIDVFARGDDDQLQHRRYRNGRWSRWRSLGGSLTSAPAVTSWERGRLDVFARGGDDGLHHRTYVAGRGWSRWHRRGGTLTSSPAAASWGPGRIDVVARGDGDTLRHRSFVAGRGWSSWRTRGRGLSSQPAIAAPEPGMLDVAARRGDRAVWLRRYARGDGWSGWTSLGGRFRSGPFATTDGTAVRIAARRTSGSVASSVRGSPSERWRPWRPVRPRQVFRGLGTWVDVFDYEALEPEAAVADMAAHGVRTLYLETARFTDDEDFHDVERAGAWLDAARAANIKVVGWYPPAYGDMRRDVRRTVAIGEFVSPAGQRFDAVGIDIERLDEVTRKQFNRRLVKHLSRVRGTIDAMMVTIVPSPFTTEPGNNWEGFPWTAVGRRSDVVVPMALWSLRDGCPGAQRCPLTGDEVYDWVLDQTRRTQELTGRPVSIEGGVNDPGREPTTVTRTRVRHFVDAVVDSGALGGSHYDFATTPAGAWPILQRLNTP